MGSIAAGKFADLVAVRGDPTCSYQVAIGPLIGSTGVWPDASRLLDFNEFCASCYAPVEKLVAAAHEIQGRRKAAPSN